MFSPSRGIIQFDFSQYSKFFLTLFFFLNRNANMVHVVIDNIDRLSGELSNEESRIIPSNMRIFIGKYFLLIFFLRVAFLGTLLASLR